MKRAVASVVFKTPPQGMGTQRGMNSQDLEPARPYLIDYAGYMPGYGSTTVGRVFIARWPLTAEVGDVERLFNDLRTAHEQTGEKVVYLLIVPAGSEPVPRPAVRAYMQRKVDELMAYCESTHVVIEGSGVMPALFRATMKAFAIATGYAGRVGTFRSIPDAISEVRRTSRVEPTEVLRAARALASDRPPA